MVLALSLWGPPAHGDSTGPSETWAKMAIPNVKLLNQNGDAVSLDDMVKHRRVSMNFVFTTCTTICVPLGAKFSALQQLLESSGEDYQLISVSIDPLVDTPQRLKAWAAQFHAGAHWALLTGAKQDVDGLLKNLKVFAADKQSHTPMVLVGSGTSGRWTRVNGLMTPAPKLAELMAVADGSGAPAASAAHQYFTDTILVDQDGDKLRFYSDLLKDRVVLIQFFFTTCHDSCPRLVQTFAELQKQLGDRLGRDVFFYSISVDPERDTPAKLKAYAEGIKAQPGWLFLSGEKTNVDLVITKLGHVGPKENHLNIFIAGNLRTGSWKKIQGLSRPEGIMQVLESVVKDPG
jgi:protein SCO1/2